MKRSKRVFFVFAFVFFVILALIAYDIAMKTSFPGKKPVQTEQPAE